MPRSSQIELPLRERKLWGGSRKKAGRKKRKGSVVSRRARPDVDDQKPVHATMRVLPEIPSLRFLGRHVRGALNADSSRPGFRLIHHSIQGNHLHLIAEGDDKVHLSRGLQGLAVRIARAINQALGRKHGKVFSDRYHEQVLSSPTQVRNALAYVVHNFRKHMNEAGRFVPPNFIDPLSSAIYLVGLEDSPLPEPSSWFLQGGYRRAGPIEIGGTRV